jgi:hypothetical protein
MQYLLLEQNGLDRSPELFLMAAEYIAAAYVEFRNDLIGNT